LNLFLKQKIDFAVAYFTGFSKTNDLVAYCIEGTVRSAKKCGMMMLMICPVRLPYSPPDCFGRRHPAQRMLIINNGYHMAIQLEKNTGIHAEE
jgi:hypothetical protein